MRPSSRRKLCLAVSLAVLTSGCYGWGGRRTPEPSSTQALPNPVRVRTDDAALVLHDATVSGDSLVGYLGDAPAARQRTAVALADVRKIEEREVSFLKTAGTSFLVTIGVVIGLVILVLISLASDY